MSDLFPKQTRAVVGCQVFVIAAFLIGLGVVVGYLVWGIMP